MGILARILAASAAFTVMLVLAFGVLMFIGIGFYLIGVVIFAFGG